MSIKIKSTVAKIPTRQNGLAFLSRELIRLEIDFKTNTYQPFVEEIIFVEENGERTQIWQPLVLLPTRITKKQSDALIDDSRIVLG